MARIPRIYQLLPAGSSTGDRHTLEEGPAHYAAHVLRLRAGGEIRLFSGQSGEWRATITAISKKAVEVQLCEQVRKPEASPDIWLCFAPVKNEKIDFLARRATELGVSTLQPVRTRHTVISRINEERLIANMIEASEQCGRLDVPELKPYLPLDVLLTGWDKSRLLFHADESGNARPIHEVLPNCTHGTKAAVIIGPEGGFSREERDMLRLLPYIKPVTLGPRILRAETAALAALAHVQAWLGDGDKKPNFCPDQVVPSRD